MAERKYPLMKRAAGDYLFVANDRKSIWRVNRYFEDGTAVAGSWPNEEPIFGHYWELRQMFSDGAVFAQLPVVEWKDGLIYRVAHPEDEGWDEQDWDTFSFMHATMREALDEYGGWTEH